MIVEIEKDSIFNRVKKIADANGSVTNFTYDPNGNLLTVTDALGQTTTYTYDVMDRLKTRTDPLQRTETYDYDAAGNLITFTDRKNQVSTFEYDALNRRTKATYANGRTRRFGYDAAGRLVQAVDSLTGLIEWRYDALDRLLTETTPQGTVQYVYDALGRRRGLGAPGQLPVAYLYDVASRLTQLTQGTQTVGLGYDAAGRRTGLTYPNGATTSYGYDAASRLIQVAQAGLVVGLQYDAAGRRTGLTYPNGTSTSYTYDIASRLTSIVHNGPAGLIESLTYTYDAAGNRISLTRATGTATLLPAAVQAAYDAANQQLQFNSASPNQTFDANGNLTFDGTNTYTWDARNRLVAISGPGLSASFQYDALGRRVSKTINGVATQYLYDGNDIVQEIGGGAVGASYTRSLNVDEPFIRQTATGNAYYHTDALGSTLTLSNAAGTVSTTYGYEAFGRTTSTGASANSFQYTGRENDGTELYYYRARYYGQTQGRFLSEDPILAPFNPLALGMCRLSNGTVWSLPGMIQNPAAVTAQRLNQYVYARDNPILFSDPSGLIDKRPCGSQIDQCIKETRGTPLGDCLGTAYGLYFGGDTSNCKKGIFTRECLRKDQIHAALNCGGRGPFPKSCTDGIGNCIENDPSFK